MNMFNNNLYIHVCIYMYYTYNNNTNKKEMGNVYVHMKSILMKYEKLDK